MAKIHKVIEILRRSDQDLVFFNSLICPVSDLFEPKRRTTKNIIKKTRQLQRVCKEMKDMGVIEYTNGFCSLIAEGGIFVPTSVVLTEKFFKSCVGPRDEKGQLKMF